jgi:hypothetical protein
MAMDPKEKQITYMSNSLEVEALARFAFPIHCLLGQNNLQYSPHTLKSLMGTDLKIPTAIARIIAVQ